MAQRGVIVARRPTPVQRKRVRRRRLLTRAAPIAAVAAIAFVVGAIFATEPGREERQVVSRYVTAWEHHDYPAMYKLLDSGSRRRVSEAKFANELRSAAATATLISLTHSRVTSGANNTIAVQMLARTRIWGALPGTLVVPFTGSGSGARVHLTPQVLFPGLRLGERLHRVMKLPPRATILASDGTPLAQGPDRSSPIPDVANQIVGTLGPIPSIDAMQYAAAGYPPNAEVGLDGLERIFQTRLAGRPGGRLMAGHRLLANAGPRPAGPVTTTISPALERQTVAAMGGQYSGIAVMNPRTGALLALAGIAFSAPQPPGSTMKIITATAALQAGIAKLTTQFPIQTSATIDGYTLQNSNGEACGGTLLNAFAVSCNSVFAPLGATRRRQSTGRDGEALRVRPAVVDPGRGRELHPVTEQDRRTRWRSAHRRSGRGSCRPRRSRWPTSPRRSRWAAGGRSRHCWPTSARGSSASRAPVSRTRSSR